MNGEPEEQAHRILWELKDCGYDSLCLGQYFKPSKNSMKFKEFLHLGHFAREEAITMDFNWVLSEPFARSRYHAEDPSSF